MPRLGSGQGDFRDGSSSVWKAKWACTVLTQSKQGFCSPRILSITKDFQMLLAQRTEWRTVVLQAQGIHSLRPIQFLLLVDAEHPCSLYIYPHHNVSQTSASNFAPASRILYTADICLFRWKSMWNLFKNMEYY